MVTTPEPTALADAYGMLKVVSESGLKKTARVVLNYLQDEYQGEEVFERLKKVSNRYVPELELSYLGGILYDPAVSRAVKSFSPFVINSPKCRAALSIKRIARRLMYDENETGRDTHRRGLDGFVNRLKRFITREE